MAQGLFRKYLSNQQSSMLRLPLTHTTDGYGLRLIRETCSLVPQPCDVFGESLLYLFYGRPSYRPNITEPPSSLSSLFPVCFILRQFADPKPVRVFPFDSGAFHAELYSSFLHRRMKLEDFLLDQDINSPSKLIKTFFRNDANYYDTKPVEGLRLPSMEFEAESYYAMISDKSRNTYDDRISAVELQFDQPIHLNQTNVLAIVLPAPFMDNEVVLDSIINQWQAVPITYELRRMQPREFTSQIFEKVKQFYVGEKIL